MLEPLSLFQLSKVFDKGKLLINKLLSQGYHRAKIVLTLKRFMGGTLYYDLVNP